MPGERYFHPSWRPPTRGLNMKIRVSIPDNEVHNLARVIIDKKSVHYILKKKTLSNDLLTFI